MRVTLYREVEVVRDDTVPEGEIHVYFKDERGRGARVGTIIYDENDIARLDVEITELVVIPEDMPALQRAAQSAEFSRRLRAGRRDE